MDQGMIYKSGQTPIGNEALSTTALRSPPMSRSSGAPTEIVQEVPVGIALGGVYLEIKLRVC